MSIVEQARQRLQGAVQGAMAAAVRHAPDALLPGGRPDPLIAQSGGAIGQPVDRVDGPLKVSGAAPFAAEFPLAGLAYAAVVHSTIAKGSIASIDAAAAEAAPGVLAVMTYRNAPRLAPPPVFLSANKAAAGDTVPVLQDDRVHWNGQPVALVIAQTQEQANHAKSLVRVTYRAEPAHTDFEKTLSEGSQPGVFMGEPLHDEVGDAEAALQASAVKVDAVYRTPFLNHNAIELHAVTAAWEGDTLRLHDATQAVVHTAWSLAQMFGLEESQVHVTSPFVGGGFGGKCVWQHQALAAAAAKTVGRPVRLMLSRESVYRLVGGRSATEQRVALGASRDGQLQALVHSGATAKTPMNVMTEPFIMPTRSAYRSKTMLLDVRTVELDMLSNTFMRAPGEAVGTFALECAMDELAQALDLDPIELRIRNEPEKDPLTGLPFSGRHIVQAWRDGAERFGWGQRNARPASVREGEWWVGMGCATATYPYYRMPGGAARITLTADGHATVDVAAHEMGMGTATAQSQVIAQRLGLPLQAVTFNYGDSHLPGLVLAGGSQQTASVGAAVAAAYAVLVKQLLELAGKDSPLSGLPVREVEGRDAGICKAGAPECRESYAALLARAGRTSITVEATAVDPLETMHWSMHSHGAMFCEARVNAVTGEVRVNRFLGSFDCGRIVNPKTATSQFRGGIIMGLGMALMEETQLDARNGRVANPSLAEYHVPVHLDVPEIDILWTDIPDPHTPMGARGIGEIGITGTAAAVANAIYNATGKRIRELPITLDKLL